MLGVEIANWAGYALWPIDKAGKCNPNSSALLIGAGRPGLGPGMAGTTLGGLNHFACGGKGAGLP